MRFLRWEEWWNEDIYGRAKPWLPEDWAKDPNVSKLNFGSGTLVFDQDDGWINVDRNPGPGIVQADVVRGLPFPDDTFDYVHLSNVMEHICPLVIWSVLEELARVSKDGCVWEILGPDPRNVVVTLQAAGHTTLIGPWTFFTLWKRRGAGDLDMARTTEKWYPEPIDHEFNPEGPARWKSWYGFRFGNITDWHLRRYFGRRIGDVLSRILGRPWTLRLVYRVVKS